MCVQPAMCTALLVALLLFGTASCAAVVHVAQEMHISALSAHIASRQQAQLGSLHAAAAAADADLGRAADAPQMPFPRNLRRIYDGNWIIDATSDAPFHYVPLPPPTPLPSRQKAPVLRAVVNNSLAAPASQDPQRTETKFAFTARKGFALLSVRNLDTPIHALNAVIGELLLRDGPYRSPRDVTMRVVGAYEWRTGLIVFVGDSPVEDSEAVLRSLYAVLVHRRPQHNLDQLVEGNMTRDRFVHDFGRALMQSRKKEAIQRVGGKASVAMLCPFEGHLRVKQDTFTDKAPRAYQLGALAPHTAGADVQQPMIKHVRAVTRTGSSVIDFAGGGTMKAQTQMRQQQQQQMSEDEMVKMTGQFVSEQCKTTLALELSTMDSERLFVKAINYTLLVTVVAFTQVIVLIRQMEMTSTQAGASRVSLMTVGLQAVADSYLCLGHLTLGIAVQALFNAFATAAFFKFICFSIFLMRWMLLIWKARRPSGFSEGWEAMRRELSMLYSRFYGSLLLGLFLLYQLQGHVRIFIFALYSFWLPQIVLNIVEDHRRPLLPVYIVGTSLTRLAIPLYFWDCPNNFLHVQPQPSTAIALVGWMSLQALMLLSQYKLGPRWFIPSILLPEKYDYYRAIVVEDDSDDDIEMQSKGEDGPLMASVESRRECCICMEPVLVNSRDRMVTPCNHFFHSHCLERWLEVRLECALCRRVVPPP